MVDSAPQLLDQSHRGVDLLDLDVPHPMRRRSHLGRLLGQIDDAAERALTAGPHGVIAALGSLVRCSHETNRPLFAFAMTDPPWRAPGTRSWISTPTGTKGYTRTPHSPVVASGRHAVAGRAAMHSCGCDFT